MFSIILSDTSKTITLPSASENKRHFHNEDTNEMPPSVHTGTSFLHVKNKLFLVIQETKYNKMGDRC
jgi:hypothetical protein